MSGRTGPRYIVLHITLTVPVERDALNMAPLKQIMSNVASHLTVRRAQMVPPEAMAMKPPGMDDRTFALMLPAMTGDAVPPGADRTMTLDGPDQIWFLVVAITCIAVPGLFLMIRIYTKFAVVRSIELADCTSHGLFVRYGGHCR